MHLKVLRKNNVQKIVQLSNENKLLFKNQFGFRHGRYREHARFKLIEWISESFKTLRH